MMSPPSNPLPIYSWPPPPPPPHYPPNGRANQNNPTIPGKFPLMGQQKQHISIGLSSQSNSNANCMSPLAALHQQLEQKQRGPWHRRLSPLKKKPSSSSFSLGARPFASSSSASPQRRPPSPEKRQRPVPVYQQMNGAKDGGGSFQEAWEHLSRQCAAAFTADGNGQMRKEQSQRLPLHVHSLPPSPTKSCPMPLPNSPPSTSTSSPLEMPDSCNPIGRVLPTALANGEGKIMRKGMADSTPKLTALAPSSSSETMSSSILASPAWYRDREGRTGYRPDDFPHGARVQSSPIKVIPANMPAKKLQISIGNDDSSKIQPPTKKPNVTPSMPQRPPHPPLVRQGQHPAGPKAAAIVLPPPIRPIRHTSTLPLPSSSSTSPSFHHLQGLPPIGPGANGGPFPLRRTQHAMDVTSATTKNERAKRDWWIGNGAGMEGGQRGEMEMADQQQMMKTSSQSQASTTTQKVVKFAETVQINEIAPRGELEGSLCSSSSSSSSTSSSSSCSSASNSSCSDQESRNSPKENGNHLANYGQMEQQMSLPKRTMTSPPLAIVRPRTTATIEIDTKRAEKVGRENGQIGRQKGKTAENGHRKLQKVHPETAELERVIEQFFQHCQSLSSLNPPNAEAHEQQQSQSQPNLVAQQPPLQQRSVYDNLAEEEGGGGPDWLHTKAKVVAQQNWGPAGIWTREGSPKRRVEVMVTTSTTSNPKNAERKNGRVASSSYSTQTLPLASRKSNSLGPPISRIPLARPSAAIRPGNGQNGGGGHHSGSESSSSCSSSSTGRLMGRPRLGSNPSAFGATGNQHPFAVLKGRMEPF